MGNSIIGEKWNNATDADVAAIDVKISDVQKKIDSLSGMFSSFRPIYEAQLVGLQVQRKKLISELPVIPINTTDTGTGTGNAGGNTKKWMIYAGIGIGIIALLIGGIYAYKKFKKK